MTATHPFNLKSPQLSLYYSDNSETHVARSQYHTTNLNSPSMEFILTAVSPHTPFFFFFKCIAKGNLLCIYASLVSGDPNAYKIPFLCAQRAHH